MSFKILPDDDEEMIRELIKVTLTQDDRFQVLEATNGAEAVAIARREHPHLVILDVRMPEMDGYRVARALRAESLGPRPAILMLPPWVRTRTSPRAWKRARSLIRAGGLRVQFAAAPTEARPKGPAGYEDRQHRSASHRFAWIMRNRCGCSRRSPALDAGERLLPVICSFFSGRILSERETGLERATLCLGSTAQIRRTVANPW